MSSTSEHPAGAAASVDLTPHGVHKDVHAGHPLEYMSGFGNEHASEALPGALPVGQNGPQICSYGLYAEQLSGTAFTVPRARNQRTWLYRVRPSVMHERFVPIAHKNLVSGFSNLSADPNQMRWFPQPLPKSLSDIAKDAEGEGDEQLDWVDGLSTMAGSGDPTSKSGIAIHVYACNKSMVDTSMYNSDGDFLIVPQEGTLHIQTEMGFLDVEPKEICVIQRGIQFRVAVDGPSRGYVCEIYDGHFQLPDLGPIGANGLANARDFLYPVAAYEDRDVDYVIINKYGGHLFSTIQHHSPFNVVAWHGNYAPCKYDLSKFNTMNSVSYDHPDPSIYTVLTCPTNTPGVALCDFVIFPPRWMVMDKSFRPPYYHRNTMTEFMGMVWGKYDAKVGFQPGGASLHSCMTPHGPDADTFLKASKADLKPEHFNAGLAFMFETTLMLKLTDWALHAPHREMDYQKCWQTLPRVFDPTVREMKALVPHAHPTKGFGTGFAHGPVAGDGTSATLAKRAATDAAVGSHGAHVGDTEHLPQTYEVGTASGAKRKRAAGAKD